MLKTMLLGTFLSVLGAAPAFADLHSTASCHRGSRFNGDPHNVAGRGTCNMGHHIENKHDPYRLIRGPGVTVRH